MQKSKNNQHQRAATKDKGPIELCPVNYKPAAQERWVISCN